VFVCGAVFVIDQNDPWDTEYHSW